MYVICVYIPKIVLSMVFILGKSQSVTFMQYFTIFLVKAFALLCGHCLCTALLRSPQTLTFFSRTTFPIILQGCAHAPCVTCFRHVNKHERYLVLKLSFLSSPVWSVSRDSDLRLLEFSCFSRHCLCLSMTLNWSESGFMSYKAQWHAVNLHLQIASEWNEVKSLFVSLFLSACCVHCEAIRDDTSC